VGIPVAGIPADLAVDSLVVGNLAVDSSSLIACCQLTNHVIMKSAHVLKWNIWNTSLWR
jgi:hypothetical protein